VKNKEMKKKGTGCIGSQLGGKDHLHKTDLSLLVITNMRKNRRGSSRREAQRDIETHFHALADESRGRKGRKKRPVPYAVKASDRQGTSVRQRKRQRRERNARRGALQRKGVFTFCEA